MRCLVCKRVEIGERGVAGVMSLEQPGQATLPEEGECMHVQL